MKVQIKLEALLRWVYVLTVVGYPIAGLLAVGLDVESRVISIPFRLGVGLLAALAMVGALTTRARLRFPALLTIFLSLYMTRLLWDWRTEDLPRIGESIVFYVGTVLIPVLAAFALATRWNDSKVAWTFVCVGSLIGASVIGMELTGFGISRSITARMGGRLSYDTLNAITIGHVGVTTILAAMPLLFAARSWLPRAILGAVILLGGATLIFSGSRGPLVALAVVLIVFAIARRKWILTLMAIPAVATLLITTKMHEMITMLRLDGIGIDASSRERLIAQENSISEFIAHPWVGSMYVDPITLEYPHNLIIETALALGVLGLALLLPMIYFAIRRSITLMRQGVIVLPLVFWQFLVGAQFSGALWAAASFFMSLGLIFAVKLKAPAPRPRRVDRRAMMAERRIPIGRPVTDAPA